jgi:hypothetical protein
MLLEPDEDVLVGTRGDRDESLEESGSLSLANGQTSAVILFSTPKFSNDYEFNIYFENLTDLTPTVLQWLPMQKGTLGFTVGISPATDSANYVMFWRVRVRDTALASPVLVDAPESGRTILTVGAMQQTIPFLSPRSTNFYGFSEWRIENLVDLPSSQESVWIQLASKTKTDFTIVINPPADTPNYIFAWSIIT